LRICNSEHPGGSNASGVSIVSTRRGIVTEEEYFEYEALVASYAAAVESGIDPDEAAAVAIGSVATPRA
jgi:hypothetical protein